MRGLRLSQSVADRVDRFHEDQSRGPSSPLSREVSGSPRSVGVGASHFGDTPKGVHRSVNIIGILCA